MDKLEEIKRIVYFPGEHFGWKDGSVMLLDKYIEINGVFCFSYDYKERQIINDEYNIKIRFPMDYPKTLPTVSELDNRIPINPDWHNDKQTGLCLAVPQKIRESILKNNSFYFFVEEFIVPFLYANSYKERNNDYPWITQAHGEDGIFESFNDFFSLQSIMDVKKFFEVIISFKYPVKGHHLCPCGSKKKFRACHGRIYWEIIKFYPHNLLRQDLLNYFKSKSKTQA